MNYLVLNIIYFISYFGGIILLNGVNSLLWCLPIATAYFVQAKMIGFFNTKRVRYDSW